MQKATTILFVTISFLPAGDAARAAQPAAAVSAPSPTPTQFQSDEASVVAGLPPLERELAGSYKGALAFNHEDVKDPWYVYIGKDQVKLLWNSNGVDEQKVFTFDQAVAVVSKNVCGAALKLDSKHRKGRLGACRYVWTLEGERWFTITVLLSPADPQASGGRSDRCKPYQVAIPGGTFLMGSKDGEENEKPAHRVTLSPYCMDRTEATVAAFRECVTAGACRVPREVPTPFPNPQRACAWDQPGVDNHAVNCVTWNEAAGYCKWRGDRLPTEEEWEFAARGTDGRKYPWGNEEPEASRARVQMMAAIACRSGGTHPGTQGVPVAGTCRFPPDDPVRRFDPVGSYPRGASPFGVLDMAGNVMEWTASPYRPYGKGAVGSAYFPGIKKGTREVDQREPFSQQVEMACRSSHPIMPRFRATHRTSETPDSALDTIGFRCAGGSGASTRPRLQRIK